MGNALYATESEVEDGQRQRCKCHSVSAEMLLLDDVGMDRFAESSGAFKVQNEFVGNDDACVINIGEC